MQIDEYKCPNCGGTVKFNSSSQAMKCPFCDTEFELAALEEYQKEINTPVKDGFDWSAQEGGESWDGADMDDLTAGSCPSCGAQLFGNPNTVATVCPCCGNAQIVIKRLSNDLKPDYIIPFRLEKKAAVEAIDNFCKGKRLLPDCFVQNRHVEEAQGIYVPFWLFDASARGHINYRATKLRMWRSGDYNYTETSHYSVLRDGNLNFEKVPVDASEKMNDDYMDAIEPFEYREMKDFHKSYLAGYVGEKYDVYADKCKERAERRIKSSLEKEFRKTVTGYATVMQENSFVETKDGKANYALFPVWVLNTKYRNENYQFMMNGQTGRLAGRLPVDCGKAWKWRVILTGILSVFFSIAAFLIAFSSSGEIETATALATAWILSVFFGFATVEYWKYQMNTARQKNEACEYVVQGSLSLKVQKDNFLYKNVVKTQAISSSGTGKR